MNAAPGDRIHVASDWRAAQVLDKALGDKDKLPDKALLDLKEQLLRDLKWDHWAALQHAATQQAFPAEYPIL
jgi:hypothetical protein